MQIRVIRCLPCAVLRLTCHCDFTRFPRAANPYTTRVWRLFASDAAHDFRTILFVSVRLTRIPVNRCLACLGGFFGVMRLRPDIIRTFRVTTPAFCIQFMPAEWASFRSCHYHSTPFSAVSYSDFTSAYSVLSSAISVSSPANVAVASASLSSLICDS